MFVDFLSLLAIEFFGLASPGPDVFYVMRTSASRGRANAMRVVLGTVIGNAIWISAVALGLALVFERYPGLANGLIGVGALYLVYIGCKMFKYAKEVDLNQALGKADSNSHKPDNSLIWKALTVNLANVKAVFYISAIMTSFIDKLPYGHLFVPLFMVVAAFVWFTCVAYLFSMERVKNTYERHAKSIDRVSGIIFIVLGSLLIIRTFL